MRSMPERQSYFPTSKFDVGRRCDSSFYHKTLTSAKAHLKNLDLASRSPGATATCEVGEAEEGPKAHCHPFHDITLTLILDPPIVASAGEHTTDWAPSLLMPRNLAECMRRLYYRDLYRQWQAVKTDFVASYCPRSADLLDQERVQAEFAAAGEASKKAKETQLVNVGARIDSLNERLDGMIKKQTLLHGQLAELAKCILLRAW